MGRDTMWNFARFGDHIAVRDENGVILTYSELDAGADEMAKIIQERCLVFILCENSIGSLFGYVGFVEHRIVPVLLNSHIEQELLDHLIKIYSPSYLWVPFKQAGFYENFEAVYRKYDYVLLRTDFHKNYLLYEKLALLLTTSGSTGSPKFVRQSYENIRANTESIVQYLGIDETERPITTLPMNYTYGLSIINSHLFVGATILLTDKGLTQKEFWTFFKEHQATSFGGVPYTYEILDRLRFFQMELPSLRTMTQAGGKLTLELHEKFARYAAENSRNFVVMYGQCEATARMGYLPADKAVEKRGSMGIAIPGGKFRLIDEDYTEITVPNITGELVYEGKNVTLGYAECGEDLIKGDERKGILFTGDMAQFDEDGYFYIVGRKKRFLKIYGNRVNLDEVERLIKGKYEIDVACAGTDDHMYIFLADNEMKSIVKDYVVRITKLNPVAFKVILIEEIPKNDAGKIRYQELETYYE